MNLKAKVERDKNFPIKKVNNCTHFFERVHKTKEVRQQKSTKSIKHQKSSKCNEVKPTKKLKNTKELINLKEVKNTKEVKTHILVFLQLGIGVSGVRNDPNLPPDCPISSLSSGGIGTQQLFSEVVKTLEIFFEGSYNFINSHPTKSDISPL